MTQLHTHEHNHVEHEARLATGPTLRGGRAYKIRGMGCAEEVAVLKQAVGPRVGGADRLAFDVLNGRMTIAAEARDVSEEEIVKAVAAAGMNAMPWAARASDAKGDNHRGQQALFTAASGICVLIGFGLHIYLAGSFADAWKLLGSRRDGAVPRHEAPKS
jgi:Cd2+/Zn2+-exporting ATPase